MNRALHCLVSFFAFIIFSYAQEEPEYLEPTQQVTYGDRQHTSRDAVFFSEMNSRGELIIGGYTERDFTFSDVQIMALDNNLEVLWSDRLSWDGISYDYPVDILIDDEDNVWVVSKNLFNYYARFVITKYDRAGKKLWEYAPPELIESFTLNMNQHQYFFDEQGYLNFYYFKGEGYDALVPAFFKLSAGGEVVDEYELPFSISSIFHLTNSGNGYHGFHHTSEPTDEFSYLRIDRDGHKKYALDLSSHMEDRPHFLIHGSTQSVTDNKGNILVVSEHDYHDRTGYLHKTVVALSVDSIGQVNYAIDHDPDKDKYLLDFTLTPENNLVLLTNSQPIEVEDEEPLLTLEIFSEEGELIYSRQSETAVGNMANFTEDRIVLRTLDGKIQVYDYELNLLSEYEPAPSDGIFVPEELHLMDGDPVMTGTTVAKKYETSDYYSEENFLVRSFDANGLAAEMTYDGEGTSKVMPHAMISDADGNFIVSYEEFLGPNNISLGGSRSPKEKKIMKFSPRLELLEEEIVDDTNIWEEPKTEYTDGNGKLHSYVISEDQQSVEYHIDGERQWTRTLSLRLNEVIFNGVLDKNDDLIFFTNWHNYGSTVHKLTPQNEFTSAAYGEYITEYVVLSNNWIFTYTKGAEIAVYSPELKMINSRKLDLYEDAYVHFMEKNNTVFLNTVYDDLVMVLDQFGNEEARFNLKGKLHGSTAFFDKDDALVINHTIGEGIYLAHGHNWSRGAISRYENIKQFLGENNNKDSDGDGVFDDLDQCPDTPYGAQIDAYGCELLKLDADHFDLKVRNETCHGNNNGQLIIEAKEAGSYLLELNGETHNFTTAMSFEKLSPGNYELCVSVVGEAQTRQCYQFIIEAGEKFMATTFQSSFSGKKELEINVLKGTAPFSVLINGANAGIFSTSEIKLTVNSGDEVEVHSAVGCEGDLKLNIDAGEEISLFPNPVETGAQLILPNASEEDFLIEIFNVKGQRMKSYWQKSGARKIELPVEDLEKGVYIIRLHLQEVENIKMIKS